MISLFARYGMQILGLRHESEYWASFAARYHLVFSRSDKSEPQQPKINQEPAPVQATVISNPTVLIEVLLILCPKERKNGIELHLDRIYLSGFRGSFV